MNYLPPKIALEGLDTSERVLRQLPTLEPIEDFLGPLERVCAEWREKHELVQCAPAES